MRDEDVAVGIDVFEFVGEFGRVDWGFGAFDFGVEQAEFVVVGVADGGNAVAVGQAAAVEFDVEAY